MFNLTNINLDTVADDGQVALVVFWFSHIGNYSTVCTKVKISIDFLSKVCYNV